VKTTVGIVLCVALGMGTGFAETAERGLSDYQAVYETTLAKLETLETQQIQTLREEYQILVKRGMEAAQKGGDLDGTLALKDELARLRNASRYFWLELGPGSHLWVLIDEVEFEYSGREQATGKDMSWSTASPPVERFLVAPF